MIASYLDVVVEQSVSESAVLVLLEGRLRGGGRWGSVGHREGHCSGVRKDVGLVWEAYDHVDLVVVGGGAEPLRRKLLHLLRQFLVLLLYKK